MARLVLVREGSAVATGVIGGLVDWAAMAQYKKRLEKIADVKKKKISEITLEEKKGTEADKTLPGFVEKWLPPIFDFATPVVSGTLYAIDVYPTATVGVMDAGFGFAARRLVNMIVEATLKPEEGGSRSGGSRLSEGEKRRLLERVQRERAYTPSTEVGVPEYLL